MIDYSVSAYDFTLDPDLIASEPLARRDESRLLVLRREDSFLEHRHFSDIAGYFSSGDILVLNDTRVFPSRLLGHKNSGAAIEVFLLRRLTTDSWLCLLKGKTPVGAVIDCGADLCATVCEKLDDGTARVSFNYQGAEFDAKLNEVGHMPLPPYIKREDVVADRERYQTVYADQAKAASVAAPTAGLHFTPELLEILREKGVKIVSVTLHVGLGTFAPVKTDDIREHKMHSEWAEMSAQTARAIGKAHRAGQRVFCVGTTSTRTVETVFSHPDYTALLDHDVEVPDFGAWTDIFIYGDYQFKAVDAMITNFHLPKSTLLMLVSALAGKENIRKAYSEAIKEKYRFYSYGDAMLII